jgi:hypothetical protein
LTQKVKVNFKEQHSPVVLAAMGVDIIIESGEFCHFLQ